MDQTFFYTSEIPRFPETQNGLSEMTPYNIFYYYYTIIIIIIIWLIIIHLINFVQYVGTWFLLFQWHPLIIRGRFCLILRFKL